MRDTSNRGRVTTSRPRLIAIQANQGTRAADGSVTPNWVNIATAITVDWRTQGGTAKFVADAPQEEETNIIRIRWRANLIITPRLHRLMYANRAYTIDAAIDVQNQHQYIDIYVKAAAL